VSRIHLILLTLSLSPILSRESSGQIKGNEADWAVHPMEYSSVGSAGWQFLKLPTNARSTAMGGIKAALAYGDANAAFMNPATAADIKDYDVQFSSMRWIADIQFSSISFVKNLGGWGCIGLNLQYLNYGEMVRTMVGQSYDHLGNDLGIVPITEGLGTVSGHDLAIGLLYSRQITKSLQLGGNLRLIEEQLDDARTRNWSLDVGTLYWTGLGSFRVSMLGRNFGPDAEFASYSEQIKIPPVKVSMPMIFILGTAYDILEMSPQSSQRMTLAVEYIKPNDGSDKINCGVEYFYSHNIYIRCGYKFNYDEETYTLGFGLEYSVAGDTKVRFDYAYADVGRFNYVNVFSLGFGL
jgi:hypothetical protein